MAVVPSDRSGHRSDLPREPLPARLAQIAHALSERFLGKDEVIRLLLIALVAGEHAVLVGPPGTAKSALVPSPRPALVPKPQVSHTLARCRTWMAISRSTSRCVSGSTRSSQLAVGSMRCARSSRRGRD